MGNVKELYRYHEFELSFTNATAAYANGDVIGGRIAVPVRAFHTSGFINKIVIDDADGEGVAIDVHIYNDAPTVIADNAAFSLATVADRILHAGALAVATGDYATYGSEKHANVMYTSGDEVQFDTDTGYIYVYLALNGAGVTFTAATDLRVIIGVWYME